METRYPSSRQGIFLIMRETIAVFDFDGTLTRSDTFLMFIIFQFGFSACMKGLCSNLGILIRYAFRKVSNHEAKQAIFSYFFKGMKISDFNAACRRFALSKIPGQIKRKAFDKCEWHLHKGHHIVIVSASIRNGIEPWAKQYGFKTVIGTEVELDNEMLTGKFMGENCYGSEKVIRFLSHFPERNNYYLYAYGNSRGDREMMKLADFPYYRYF
jgi:HAD superfamily hydrolase (TIGR01490 family)